MVSKGPNAVIASWSLDLVGSLTYKYCKRMSIGAACNYWLSCTTLLTLISICFRKLTNAEAETCVETLLGKTIMVYDSCEYCNIDMLFFFSCLWALFHDFRLGYGSPGRMFPFKNYLSNCIECTTMPINGWFGNRRNQIHVMEEFPKHKYTWTNCCAPDSYCICFLIFKHPSCIVLRIHVLIVINVIFLY